jgi:hypothetical protein
VSTRNVVVGAVIRLQRRHRLIAVAEATAVLYGVAHIASAHVTYATKEAVVVRDPMRGFESHPVRTGGEHHVRWFYVLLLVVIAIAAIAGIASTMAMGQPQVAFVIGLVAVAFFSRIGC